MTAGAGRPRGVSKFDWEVLLMDLEEYRDRDPEDPYNEASEAAQTIAEKCVQLFLPKADDD